MIEHNVRKPKVLIVDDIAENIFALKNALKVLDVDVVSANSGNEALAQTLKYDFALILLDVQMPEMDGYEIAEILQFDERTANIPIIFLTAIDQSSVKEMKGYKSGAVDFIFKPFNEFILLSKVRVFLELYMMKVGLETMVSERTAELEESNHKLKEGEKQIRTILENIPGVIFRIMDDDEWSVVFISDVISEITSFPVSDFTGSRKRSFKSLVFSEDLELVEKTIKKSVDDGTPFILEYRMVDSAGKLHWVYEKGQGIYDWEGELLYIDGAIFDISEQKKDREQLIRAQKMETVGTLAGGLAHDFNNVLGGIMGTISILNFKLDKNKNIETEALRKYLGTIERSGQRAAHMVEQLLAFTRKHEIVFEAVNLNSTLEHILKICENTFDKSIRFNVKNFPQNVTVKGDASQLEQVFLNLCMNASHAMTIMRKEGEKPGGTLTIEIISIIADRDKHLSSINIEGENHNYWVVSISDTGVGMSFDVKERIFEPFFTTKGKGAGTGLGG